MSRAKQAPARPHPPLPQAPRLLPLAPPQLLLPAAGHVCCCVVGTFVERKQWQGCGAAVEPPRRPRSSELFDSRNRPTWPGAGFKLGLFKGMQAADEG
jgi:hypothetical protein